VKIALDAMGGDLAPKATVEGAVLAARDFGIEIVLVGERELLARELGEHRTAGLAISIEHAPEQVGMDEGPMESALGKPQSSIHVGLELVKSGEARAFVSAGNSGAVMTVAIMILGTLPGVDRPAIASLVPASDGFALLIDAGANTEVKPLNLAQFAVMGSVYAHRVRAIANPRIGILANGEEDSKGTDLTRAAAAMLREMGDTVNYIGYVEGRDINRAKADVVVTDGFTGNVALKTMEGFAAFLLGNLRDVFSVGLGRIAFLLVRKRLGAIRERLDPAEYGGAPLLGLSGVTIIAHGSSSPRAIRNAIRAAANEALVERVSAEIVERLVRHPAVAPAKPAGKGFRAMLGRMRERLHRHPREARDTSAQPGAAPPSPAPTPSAAPMPPASPSRAPLSTSSAAPKPPAPPSPAPVPPVSPPATAASADHASAPSEDVAFQALEPMPVNAAPSPNGVRSSRGGLGQARDGETEHAEGDAPEHRKPGPS
jgi:glycerol-3-phosphate acyltransferase PlsX